MISTTNRLLDLFVELAATPSPSRSERACARLLAGYLAELGVEVVEDGAASAVGGDTGNLHCRLPATAPGTPIFLCAHMDTVPPIGPIEPVVRDGYVRNARPDILGADNKAAIAVMLDAVRTVVEHHEPTAGIEVVLTVGEELALQGAKHFDVGRLEAQVGYVYDHSGPIGNVVTAGPSRTIVRAEMVGIAAHAGIEPERGRNAIVAAAHAIARMPTQDAETHTTLTVATIAGGVAVNVVPERCALAMEVRSRDNARCVACVEQACAVLEQVAAEHGCRVEVDVSEEYYAYSLTPDDPAVRMAVAALRACGFEAAVIATGGGSDAHVFNRAGKSCVNLGHGVENFHRPDERVAVQDLVHMRDVSLALIRGAVVRP